MRRLRSLRVKRTTAPLPNDGDHQSQPRPRPDPLGRGGGRAPRSPAWIETGSACGGLCQVSRQVVAGQQFNRMTRLGMPVSQRTA